VGTNFKLARELLVKRQGEIAERAFFPERHRTRVRLEDAAKAFLKWAQVNVSTRGFERYRCSTDNLVRAFGRLHLDEVGPATVEAFKAERMKTVKPATINRDLTVLKRIYNLILKGQLLPEAAVPESLPRRIRLLRENNLRVRYLSPREYAELLLACDRLNARRSPTTRAQAIDLKTLVVVAVHTGMRESEILTLK
jgi:integrase